jgi:hypothetical protein
MIGHIPEYHSPATAPGCNGIYPDGDRTARIPSIVGRRIILPLRFWFNSAAATSFPIEATRQMEFRINVTLRRLAELYTVVDSASGNRIRPPADAHIGTFMRAPTDDATLDLNTALDVNFIFLEAEERKRFVLSNPDYLITQVQRITHETANTVANIDIQNFVKPVAELFFVIRRTDLESVNQWSNFTNWPDDSPPFRPGFLNPFGDNPTITAANISLYKTPYLLRSGRIILQGAEITNGHIHNFDNGASDLNGKDATYFNYIQPYMTAAAIPPLGIYSYSFALDANRLQPAGAVNMSSIAKKEIILALNDKAATGYTGTPYDYTIYVFAVNYEILRIMNGMCGVVSVN